MSSKRRGQIRFEAWVPEDLYRAFSAQTRNRKGWLVAAMRAHTFPDAPVDTTQAAHSHSIDRTDPEPVYSGGQERHRVHCVCGHTWLR